MRSEMQCGQGKCSVSARSLTRHNFHTVLEGCVDRLHAQGKTAAVSHEVNASAEPSGPLRHTAPGALRGSSNSTAAAAHPLA